MKKVTCELEIIDISFLTTKAFRLYGETELKVAELVCETNDALMNNDKQYTKLVTFNLDQ